MPDSLHDTTIIHPSAIVADGATIGPGTKVWHWTHIMRGAVIGDHCILGQNVFVAEGVVIGARCKIQNNVSIYRGVTLEDDVFVGPSAVFTNVLTPRAEVSRHDQFSPTLVQQGATIGANATIVCGAVIGPYAFVGAGAVVTAAPVAAHAIMLGVPARPRGYACYCGVPLDFWSSKPVPRFSCPECRRRYAVGEGENLEELE